MLERVTSLHGQYVSQRPFHVLFVACPLQKLYWVAYGAPRRPQKTPRIQTIRMNVEWFSFLRSGTLALINGRMNHPQPYAASFPLRQMHT
jgi:hypothetical protein